MIVGVGGSHGQRWVSGAASVLADEDKDAFAGTAVTSAGLGQRIADDEPDLAADDDGKPG